MSQDYRGRPRRRHVNNVALLVCLCGILAIVITIGVIALAYGNGIDPIIDVRATPTPDSTAVFLPVETATPAPTAEPTETPEPTPTIDPTRPIIAFTFDDGPAQHATNQILDVVEQYDIRVTFFVVGTLAQKHPEILQRAASLGCVIGNHTQTHEVRLKDTTAELMHSALDPVDDFVESTTGIRPTLVRPPWGSFDDTALEVINRPVILWSVDTEDWRTKDKDAILTEIRSSVFDGAILLMHDLYIPTAEAFTVIVPELIEQGYQLVTVPELFAARGIPLEAGHAYRFAKPAPTPTAEPAS